MIAFWQESYDKPKTVLKSKDEKESKNIILLTKIHIVKAMIFLVVMYGFESWTIKKAQWQRIDAF